VDKHFYESPLGTLEICANEEGLLSISFWDDVQNKDMESSDNEHIISCISQLDEYFTGVRHEFDIPLIFKGTEFQNKVWRELLNIPFGEIRSYQQIATAIGNPKSVRAVGAANGKNPITIIVPCHRVIGADGNLIGYGGGLWRKKWLLDHEKI